MNNLFLFFFGCLVDFYVLFISEKEETEEETDNPRHYALNETINHIEQRVLGNREMVSLKEITEFYKSKLIDTTEAAENIRAEKLRVSTNASIFRSSKRIDIIDYEGQIFGSF